MGGEDLLDRLDLDIYYPQVEYTCKNDSGKSLIDYVLVTRNIMGMVKNIKVIGGDAGDRLPFAPHYAIHFELHAEASTTWQRRMVKPKRIDIKKDDKNDLIKWQIDDSKWEELYRNALPRAQHKIKEGKNLDAQTQHAERIGVKEDAVNTGIKYLQWSIAAEEAQAIANCSDGRIKANQRGRGAPPEFKWTTIEDKTTDRPIEHQQWRLPAKMAVKGADLYSTLWATIANMLRRMSADVRRSNSENDYKIVSRI